MTEPAAQGLCARLAIIGAYPAVMVSGFALFAAFSAAGLSPLAASYVAALAAAALITLHEIRLPYRRAWQPGVTDIGTDALFMVAVQVALPYLLSLLIVSALSDVLGKDGVGLSAFWPHHWPVAAQACLMLLAADFARYWLHRAFHGLPGLWRFHAVHHSPHRLYWLNVGRFHPLDKAGQYLFDALPFLLLGVSNEVLAAYFVFYAINGFFQHSNCRVSLGPLNYIVSGPELHRWHHSILPAESDRNFGNNLILWDILFGTRFLPYGRAVETLGLKNRAYPMGFLAQMKAPFISGRDSG